MRATSCGETAFSQHETTGTILVLSTHISQHEKRFSLQLIHVDQFGETLRQRVTELLAARPEMSRAEFGRRIRRGHSWISEFLAGLRSTNDLRLVIKIARVFGVSVGYLLGETDDPLDPSGATLLATWHALQPADRTLLSALATALRQRAGSSIDLSTATPDVAPVEERGRTRTRVDEPAKRKR